MHVDRSAGRAYFCAAGDRPALRGCANLDHLKGPTFLPSRASAATEAVYNAWVLLVEIVR